MRRLSAVPIAVVSIGLALVGNLATNTVAVDVPWWPWVVWTATGLLVTFAVVAEIRSRTDEPPQRSGVDPELEVVTGQLAQAVLDPRRREDQFRRIHDPVALPVCWHHAPEVLIDHWANIHRAPAGVRPGPVPVAGELGQISAVYQRIPSGRLIILGPAGAGKTVVAARLAIDLLAVRRPGAPVPVIVSIGSWNPSTTALADWLVAQLVRDHPGLAVARPGGGSLAAALIDAGLILPILDGYDEIAVGLRRAALQRLNTMPDTPLVVTSRTAEYAAAVAGADVLTAAAGIEIDPVSLDDLVDYLPRTTRRSTIHNGHATGLWTPVLTRLRGPSTDPANVALREALSTPLMVYLARTVYSDAPEHDPADLLDTARFPTSAAVEEHLIASFVPAVYRHPPATGDRHWDPEDARHWLGYLARHLDTLGTRDLAWWQLRDTVPRTIRMLAFGLLGLLTFALTAVLPVVSGASVANVLPYVLPFELVLGFGIWVRRSGHPSTLPPPSAIAEPTRTAGKALVAGLATVVAFATSLGFVVGSLVVFGDSLSSWLAIGLTAVLAVGCAAWLHSIALAPAGAPPSSARPPHSLVAAVAAGLATGLTTLVAAGLAVVMTLLFAFLLTFGLPIELAAVPAMGLALLLTAGIAIWLQPAGPPATRPAPRTDSRRRTVLRRVAFDLAAGQAVLLAVAFAVALPVALWTETSDSSGAPAYTPMVRIVVVLTAGAVVALAVVLTAVLAVGRDSAGPVPARTQLRIRGRGSTMLKRFVVGLSVGLLAFLPVAPQVWFASTLAVAFTVWTQSALVFGVAFALTNLQAPIDVAATASGGSLADDRRNTIRQVLTIGIVLGLLFGLIFGLGSGLVPVGPVEGLAIGLTTGLLFGLAFGLMTNAWGQWLILVRGWLPLTGRLPWRIGAFIADAHHRGVLRQSGAVHQFRHALLHDHLAHPVEHRSRTP